VADVRFPARRNGRAQRDRRLRRKASDPVPLWALVRARGGRDRAHRLRAVRCRRADSLLGTSGGVSHWLIAVLRWPAAAIFLGLAVGIVARFAPVEHRGARWASVGATLIVVAWLVESAVYAWFLENVASYKSASGNLLLLIVLTTYLYISSVVFLVGAQLDEVARRLF
jgi:hypothetical protein